MDFLTAFPYWGILLLVAINAILVSRLAVRVDEDNKDDHD